MLDADFAVKLGDFEMSQSVHASRAEVVSVVGPNGAGKTTLLRVLAGLQPIDSGRVTLGSQVWDDPSVKEFRPADKRDCALVLADPLLFPHMSVRSNLTYGLRSRGMSRYECDLRADTWLDRLGLQGLGDRRPGSLSTGQQQRVSLGRALATDPQLLLLDEPLSTQDPSVRSDLRSLLRDLLATHEGVCVVVTHDVVDAFTLGDRVAVIEQGQTTQQGSPHDLTTRPSTKFVAQMVGLNLLPGEAEGYVVKLDGGGELQIADAHGGPVQAAFAPHSVILSSTSSSLGTSSSPRNQWPTTVVAVQQVMSRVRVELSGPPHLVAEVTPAAAAELHLREGQRVVAALKATEIEVYPR